MSKTLLVVEDQADLAAIVADYAKAEGYAVSVVSNGIDALDSIRKHPPDLIVLDLMLPGLDGLSVCREVRAHSELPIIMLTARAEEIDRLIGLDAGADDYVCKPFSPRELLARIKAVLRRSGMPVSSSLNITIDSQSRAVAVGGKHLVLTRTEFNLMRALLQRPGTVFSRAQLLDIADDDSLDVSDRAVDTHIKNLRRKLAKAAPGVDIIHSVYGIGYRAEW